MKTMTLMWMALALLAGCGKQDGPSTPAPTCSSGTTCAVKVTAESAPTYYKQFQYQTVGSCADKSIRFTWLSLANRIVVAKAADGKDITAEVNLYLNADGSYAGEYQENTQQRIEEGFEQTTESKNKREWTGHWSTVAEHLVIDNIGQSDAVTIKNWPGVKVDTAATDLNPALNGKKLVFVNYRSVISKDGKTVDQYCAEAH